jgi:hypothetical protein
MRYSPTGQRVNTSKTHPYRGISRTNSCSLQPTWGMYICQENSDYRMLIIESMDEEGDTRRLSPIVLVSSSGYVNIINGPRDHSTCGSSSCRQRISTFTAIVQSGENYTIYLSSSAPKHIRFRLINADAAIKCLIAVRFDSYQQIDVYANTVYVSPTNRDMRVTRLLLLDQPNNVTLASPAGSNYFDRFVSFV